MQITRRGFIKLGIALSAGLVPGWAAASEPLTLQRLELEKEYAGELGLKFSLQALKARSRAIIGDMSSGYGYARDCRHGFELMDSAIRRHVKKDAPYGDQEYVSTGLEQRILDCDLLSLFFCDASPARYVCLPRHAIVRTSINYETMLSRGELPEAHDLVELLYFRSGRIGLEKAMESLGLDMSISITQNKAVERFPTDSLLLALNSHRYSMGRIDELITDESMTHGVMLRSLTARETIGHVKAQLAKRMRLRHTALGSRQYLRQAERLSRQAISDCPWDHWGYEELAMCMFYEGDYRGAYSEMLRAYARHPGSMGISRAVQAIRAKV